MRRRVSLRRIVAEDKNKGMPSMQRMKKNSPFRSLFGILHSMKLGITVLVLIVAACVAGSLILQDQIPAYYEMNYGSGMACFILALELDHVFSCWWFLLLTAFLCLNLALCSVLRFGAVWRESRRWTLEERKGKLAHSLAGENMEAAVWDYRCRYRIGLWGPWLCHVGMLLLIAGFALGQRFSLETYVYGVPGETLTIEGTGYTLHIDDFRIELREDETVEQYTAELTISEEQSGRQLSGTAQVNAPFSAFGLKLYQNSTDWACQVDVIREGIQEESLRLCVGEILSPASMPELALVFQKFYPDFAYTEEGAVSKSSRLDNPCAAFLLYYEGELLANDVVGIGYEIVAEPYRFVFHDPQPYTLIQIIRDPFRLLAGLGGLVILVSLLLCFYLRPEEECTVCLANQTVYGWRHTRGKTGIWKKEDSSGEEEEIE